MRLLVHRRRKCMHLRNKHAKHTEIGSVPTGLTRHWFVYANGINGRIVENVIFSSEATASPMT